MAMANLRVRMIFAVLVAVVLILPKSFARTAENDPAKDAAGMAESNAKTSPADAKPPKTGGEQKSTDQAHGIELGKFDVRMHRAVPSQSNRVAFTLYAAVQPDEAKHFEQLLDRRQNKVREQVIVSTRLVSVEDFDDADFTKFRRRVLLRLHRTLPELAIDNVYVSDFELVVENN
jgi:hypothetical protein